MGRMELKEGVRVFTSDKKEAGRVNHFVIDPVTDEITHLLVQRGWLLLEDKVVPFETVHFASEHMLMLSTDINGFKQLPAFEESYYVRATEADSSPSGSSRHVVKQPERSGKQHDDKTREDVSRGGRALNHGTMRTDSWYRPHRYVGDSAGIHGSLPMETVRNIPAHTILLKSRADVIGSDGKRVGDLESLLVATDSNTATHFVILQGRLFKKRRLIPAHWIETVDEEKLQLAVSSKRLEILPTYGSSWPR